MMNSIDRKLARVAREIELAKPPCMSFFDFERISHDYVLVGPVDGSKKQAPQPPSVQKFNVGDRVRAIASFDPWHAVGDTGVVLEVFDGLIVVRLDASETTNGRLLEYGTSSYPERFELIPSDAGPAFWDHTYCSGPTDIIAYRVLP